MQRRQFISNLACASAVACLQNPLSADQRKQAVDGTVMTVCGPVAASDLGLTLTHEHILVDFVGADAIRSGGYDYNLVAKRAIPHLRELRQLGVDTLVECTPAYIGRDPVLLKRLSEESEVHLITNTGFYGARDGFFVPASARKMSAQELAAIWIDEARNGIGKSGIFPGFIKTAVNPDEISELDRRLVHAAAITHRETGLTIHSHTGRTPACGYQQLEILKEQGIDPSAWVWVHATGMQDLEDLRAAFEAGAWISFDNLRPDAKSVDRMLKCLRFAKDNGWIDQILISHDAGWFEPNKPDGGEHRSYTVYFTHLLDRVAEAGLSREDLLRVSTVNAANAMVLRKRVRGNK